MKSPRNFNVARVEGQRRWTAKNPLLRAAYNRTSHLKARAEKAEAELERAREALREARDAMLKIANEWRDDWHDFDGRILLSQTREVFETKKVRAALEGK